LPTAGLPGRPEDGRRSSRPGLRIGIDKPSISRLASLSGAFDLFFRGWSARFAGGDGAMGRRAAEPRRVRSAVGLVESAFYLVYSGGDDLFLVGPWSRRCGWRRASTPSSALRRRQPQPSPVCRHRRGAAPVPRAALRGAGKRSAGGGQVCRPRPRQRLRQTVTWSSMTSCSSLGATWRDGGGGKDPPRFVYHLLRLHSSTYRRRRPLLWIPSSATPCRTVDRSGDELQLLARVLKAMPNMAVPVSYVSLKTRER